MPLSHPCRLKAKTNNPVLITHLYCLAILLIFFHPSLCFGMDIVIGVATSLQLLEGWESLQAVELAVEEINNRGGVRIGRESLPLRLKILDLHESSDEGPVSQALLSLETFIQTEQPRAILVGPFRSEVLLAGMDMLAKSRIPLLGTIAMSPASEVKILKDPRYKNIFRLGLDSKYLVEYLIKIMRFLKEKFHFRKVYIINQDVAWTRSAASMLVKLYFEKAGWEVIALDTYPSGASDFTEGLKKAREKKAQLILPIFDMPESHLLVKQWNDMKVPALLCGFISPMVGPGAWGRFGNMIAGSLNVIFEMGNVPSTSFKPANDFYQAYRNKFGEEIEAGHGPAPAYESVYVLAEAIERAGSLDPDRLIKALEQTDRLGSMGRIRFHRGHQVIFGEDPDKEAVACVLQWGTDGRRTIVYPPAVAEGKIALPPNLHQFPKSRR